MVSETHEIILQLLSDLKGVGQLPAHVQKSAVGPFAIVNVFSELNSEIISDSVTTGFDKDVNLALLKALVEWIERNAGSYAKKSGQLSCQTERSDGLAAFPIYHHSTSSPGKEAAKKMAKKRARENALAEAIERFAWAQWWDHSTTHYEITGVEHFDSDSVQLLGQIQELNPVVALQCIKPILLNAPEFELLIFLAELKTGGFVSGGAAGLVGKREATSLRGLGELLRHAQSARKIREGASPTTFYEKRLAHFLSENGTAQVRERLSKKGSQLVALPTLKFDEEIYHPLAGSIYVHRCLFENQPPFIGGELERLCL